MSKKPLIDDKFEIPSITQEHPMGCAVACVASVLNISYQSALELFSNPQNAWTNGYFCVDLIEALGKKNITYLFKEILNQQDPILSQHGTIIFIDTCHQYPCGHYLVKTIDGWMNPWANYPSIMPAKSGIIEFLPSLITHTIYSNSIT